MSNQLRLEIEVANPIYSCILSYSGTLDTICDEFATYVDSELEDYYTRCIKSFAIHIKK